MTTQIELSEDAFAALFRPRANHLNSNASFDWGDGFGTLYETYGEDLEHVQCQDRNRIWTLISGEGGDYVVSGFHFVNRLGYFITGRPVPDGVSIEVCLEDVGLDSEFESVAIIPQSLVERIQLIIDHFWGDEERNFTTEYSGDPEGHVFESLRIVREWIASTPSNTEPSTTKENQHDK